MASADAGRQPSLWSRLGLGLGLGLGLELGLEVEPKVKVHPGFSAAAVQGLHVKYSWLGLRNVTSLKNI